MLCLCRFTEAERINGRWAMAGCAGVLGQVSTLLTKSDQYHASCNLQMMKATLQEPSVRDILTTEVMVG